MAVVKRGRGKPFTLFAPGGQGEDLEARMRYADEVPGTKIGFAYENSGDFEALARVRRQAERDAAEVQVVLRSAAALAGTRPSHAIFRVYGVQRALLDKSWVLPDVELPE